MYEQIKPGAKEEAIKVKQMDEKEKKTSALDEKAMMLPDDRFTICTQ